MDGFLVEEMLNSGWGSKEEEECCRLQNHRILRVKHGFFYWALSWFKRPKFFWASAHLYHKTYQTTTYKLIPEHDLQLGQEIKPRYSILNSRLFSESSFELCLILDTKQVCNINLCFVHSKARLELNQ